MKNVLPLLFLLIGFADRVQSQKSPDGSDTLAVAETFEKGWKSTDLDLSDSLGQKTLEAADRLGYRRGQGLGYLLLARTQMYQGEFDQALNTMKKAEKVFQGGKDYEKYASLLAMYGSLGLRTGDLEMASRKSFELIRFGQLHSVPRRLALAHETVATVYQRQGNFPKAITHAKKALDLNRELDKPGAVAGVGHLLGLLYFQQGNNKEASRWFYDSIEHYKKVGDSVGVAVDYSHLGLIEKEKDHGKGIRIMENAQSVLNESAFHHNALYNLGSLARAYFDIFKSDSLQKATGINRIAAVRKAEAYAVHALELSRELGDVQNEMESLSIYSDISHSNGRYQESYQAIREYMALYDSVYSQENKNRIAELESAQTVALKDKEIQISKLQLATTNRQRWTLAAVLAVVALLTALFFYQARRRKSINNRLKQLNLELEAANHVKARFLGILNHDLRGPAASVVSYLQLTEGEKGLGEEEKSGYRKKIQQSAEDLLETMEDLLLWSKGQMQHFEPEMQQVATDELFRSVRQLYPQMSFESSPGVTVTADPEYLKTIVRNLTANAIKNAAPHRPLSVHWHVSESSQEVSLVLTDNGKGAPAESFKALQDDTVVSSTRTGLGLHLVRDLSKAIGCAVSVDSRLGEGTVFRLRFKKAT